MGFTEYNFKNPDFHSLCYITATANLKDKHDRSAPSDYHWKILKCRMIIFSISSILASPDTNDIKQVHIIFRKHSDDYNMINSSFKMFNLVQNGSIKKITPDIFKMCFEYTLTAKMAPTWNKLGNSYLINNRDFLTCTKPQDGVEYYISCNELVTTLQLQPIKIHVLRTRNEFMPGEWVRVLPSLNKATVEDSCESLPEYGSFRSYNDLRRHWKNIHGYRLPEEELHGYTMVRFWRGEPLTYPKMCLLGEFPVIIPITKPLEKLVLAKFFECFEQKFSTMLGERLTIIGQNDHQQEAMIRLPDTQNVSLCTPTPNVRRPSY